jgi:hypothetical protein
MQKNELNGTIPSELFQFSAIRDEAVLISHGRHPSALYQTE